MTPVNTSLGRSKNRSQSANFLRLPGRWPPMCASSRSTPAAGRGTNFRFSRALPTGGIAHAALTRAPPICLSRGGDACVLGVVERAGNALYGARVHVELGRRL